jgi:hypothetical protein
MSPDDIRFVRIPDTLHLEELDISEALLPEAGKLGLTVVSEARSVTFDDTGRIQPF